MRFSPLPRYLEKRLNRSFSLTQFRHWVVRRPATCSRCTRKVFVRQTLERCALHRKSVRFFMSVAFADSAVNRPTFSQRRPKSKSISRRPRLPALAYVFSSGCIVVCPSASSFRCCSLHLKFYCTANVPNASRPIFFAGKRKEQLIVREEIA